MGEVINLKRVKKGIARERAAQRAEENRIRHGRSKAEQRHDREANRKLQIKLDQHRIGGED